MTTVTQMAQAFANPAKKPLSHPSVIVLCSESNNNRVYKLHNNPIATVDFQMGKLLINWCDWYTPTTANHLNEILQAFKIAERLAYSQAKKQGATSQIFAISAIF